MKKYNIKNLLLSSMVFIALFSSCHDDLLDQRSRDELPSSEFWKNIDDAEYALNGAVADIRYIFSRDYYLDGMGEYLNVSGSYMQGASSNADPSKALRNGAAYDGFYELNPSGYGGQFSNMYKYCYGGINRCNYVIEGLENMIKKQTSQDNIKKLEEFVGEAKLFRALIYLRLTSMWGDVPYIDQRIYRNSEVATISRTPLAEVKTHMIEDLTDAIAKLPVKKSESGRM